MQQLLKQMEAVQRSTQKRIDDELTPVIKRSFKYHDKDATWRNVVIPEPRESYIVIMIQANSSANVVNHGEPCKKNLQFCCTWVVKTATVGGLTWCQLFLTIFNYWALIISIHHDPSIPSGRQRHLELRWSLGLLSLLPLMSRMFWCLAFRWQSAGCGKSFEHRIDCWTHTCRHTHTHTHLDSLRQEQKHQRSPETKKDKLDKLCSKEGIIFFSNFISLWEPFGELMSELNCAQAGCRTGAWSCSLQ